ncbi:uncharacterized protein LOC111248001 [Varroa destructor]|uniref:CUB domain-containing protein n=1 Tax=Varroa destructor TaxID=109461 RepID=A0A7M7JPX1_VARDE|nr:uncharacterized protein LOC111248001 [Varroa destructor]
MHVRTVILFSALTLAIMAGPAVKSGSEPITASSTVNPATDKAPAMAPRGTRTNTTKSVAHEAINKLVQNMPVVQNIAGITETIVGDAPAADVAQSEAAADIPQVRQQHLDPCEQGQGVCMSGFDCTLQRGENIGNCDGGGVCCHIAKTCEKGKEVEISTNNTYFIEPQKVWDPEGSIHCGIRIRKLTPLGQHICQMKLDFVNFNIVGPDPQSGKCKYDMLTIEGADANTRVHNLCGLNDGQHVYVDVKHTDSIKLRMNIDYSKDPNRVRKWNIRVTQLPCHSPRLAPPGCLQYFEEYSGIVKSFNYRPQGVNETSYPLGLRYAICFKRGPDSCRVFFRKAGPFGLGEAPEPHYNPSEIDTECYSKNATTGAIKVKAYLQIDNVRHCGRNFADEYKTEDNGINAITFVSPDSEETRDKEIPGQPPGFKFIYRLLACGSGN